VSLGTETIIFDELAADPGTPESGQIWYRTDLERFRYFDGLTTHQFSTFAELQAHINDAANPHATTLELARQAGDTFAGNVNMGGNEMLDVATATLVTSAPNLQQVRDEITQAIQNDAWHDPVIDTLNDPPVSPALGDRYLIDTAPTGAWVGFPDYITEWNGSSWDFFGPPEAGWITYDQSVPQFVQYNGVAWAPFGTAVDHGSLLGLLDDDHPQYLLVNGTRAMSGNLDMGANDVVNVGLVDGVDVSAHASRHVSGGADQIDGDVLDITYVPTNYTRDITPPEVTSLVELTAHLAGIDNALAATGQPFKAGRALNADFNGNPLVAAVTFTTPFADATYAVTLGPVTTGRGYSPRVLNKTAAGFTIRLGSNNKTALISVDWRASDEANP
jgi:hypothetical protein